MSKVFDGSRSDTPKLMMETPRTQESRKLYIKAFEGKMILEDLSGKQKKTRSFLPLFFLTRFGNQTSPVPLPAFLEPIAPRAEASGEKVMRGTFLGSTTP